MNRNDPSKESVSFRVEKTLKKDFYQMAERLGPQVPDLLRSFMIAAVQHEKRHGRLSLPIELAPPNTADSIPKSALNGIIREALSTYGSALEKERHAS